MDRTATTIEAAWQEYGRTTIGGAEWNYMSLAEREWAELSFKAGYAAAGGR
ncbi:hypothetical protein LCGC14_0443810 [marine sediment metagenome]|uniref:Uncharacterized protein n=1 Tax=marine sediment metagenome TaxID=412755 RepID=A0A0F9SJR3_9ZZZZ